ncbi:MAG: hypothetical protein K2Z81_11295 [Cyanobacteria bacterium]|nr:hypothetical protein [Cyanobacteriota bacterium]
MIKRLLFALSLGLCVTSVVSVSSAIADEPFKLGVEERGYLQDPYQGQAAYPAPEAVPVPSAPMQARTQKSRALTGGAQQTRVQPPKKQQPLQAGVTKSVPLPQGFLGAWLVRGRRQSVQALSQFQAGASSIFSEQTQNVWNITGSPNSGYAFSNEIGVKSQIFVDRVSGNTAFIRYQHQIKNTMAQEAIVMQLVPGGAQFNGLERISIVKQGEPKPRAQVTYELIGTRK